MELVRKNIRPRDIMTKEALMNALTVDMALGCSTNSMLHLPAIAHECDVELNLDIANEISAVTPNLCHLGLPQVAPIWRILTKQAACTP